MSVEELQAAEREMDRLCELTNIGAGHAATAFSQLAGRQIQMSVPRVCVSEPDLVPRFGAAPQPGLHSTSTADADEDWPTGVLFEFEGGIGGLIGILFRTPMRESLVESLLGQSDTPHLERHIESALMEVGNILVSRVATAISETIGVRVLPSIPTLAMERAGSALDALARRRVGENPIRIECELKDDEGEIGGLLVLFPDTCV